MLKKKKAFLEILCVELDDLNEDIKLLINDIKDKFEKNEITNYVHMENVAVLQNEIFGVDGFKSDIQSTNSDDFENLDDLSEKLLEDLRIRVKAKGIAQSIIGMIERKMTKVRTYVER